MDARSLREWLHESVVVQVAVASFVGGLVAGEFVGLGRTAIDAVQGIRDAVHMQYASEDLVEGLRAELYACSVTRRAALKALGLRTAPGER